MRDKNSEKSYRTLMENINLNGSKKELHRKWGVIVKELSAREISFEDINDPESPKQRGLMDLAKSQKMTIGDLVILRQCAEAIEKGNVRSAEFLRDTMGEKPSTQIDINDDTSVLSKMSLEELRERREIIFSMKEKMKDEIDDGESGE